MSSSDNSTISRADLDAQTTQMNARFDAIMLLLEDHTKLKNDLRSVKEEVTLLHENMNTFTSRLNNQDTIINNFAPHVIDIINQQDATILPQVVRSVVQEELGTSAPDTIALE